MTFVTVRWGRDFMGHDGSQGSLENTLCAVLNCHFFRLSQSILMIGATVLRAVLKLCSLKIGDFDPPP